MTALAKKSPARADARAVRLPAQWLELAHIIERRSREEWKQLPLEFLPPNCGRLLLVFDVFDEPVTWVDDWSGKTLHSQLELDEVRADHLQYRRAGDPQRRAKLAKRIRRRWCALVDHAIGYRVAGSLDVLEFAP